MTDLTPNASHASATLINNHGLIVGRAEQRTFVWQDGKVRYLSRDGLVNALAMNDQGQIVGWTSDKRGGVAAAVVWSPGGELTRLPGGRATAAAINGSGVIAGNAVSGVVTWAGGKIRRISPPPAPNGARPAVVAINEAGDIIGNATTDEPSPLGRSVRTYGFIRRAGKWVVVGTPKRNAQVNALNDQGQVVGWRRRAAVPRWERAFLWQNGNMIMLNSPPGPVDASTAVAVNNSGQVVGETGVLVDGFMQKHGLIWQNGTVTALGSLFRGGESSPTAINEGGQVVGWSFDARTRRAQAFVWAAGRMTNLGGTACLSSYAYAINDRGQIVGDCERTKNRRHAVVWTPADA
jgi:probable HAF family extracellular repeat protein